MQHIFEGSIYFVAGQRRGKRLFKSSVYSRAVFKYGIHSICHNNTDLKYIHSDGSQIIGVWV